MATIREKWDRLQAAMADLQVDIDAAYPPTAPPAQSIETVLVPAGADLQAVVNGARAGTMLVLQGTSYGALSLPLKDGDGGIFLRPFAPVPYGRVEPGISAQTFPRIGPLTTQPKAHDYTLTGLCIAGPPGDRITAHIGSDTETVLENLPTRIMLDRIYMPCDPAGTRMALALNCRAVTVSNSYVEGFQYQTTESKAIGAWNAAGPFTIVNNFLEAAGVNVMFGGNDCRIPGVGPTGLNFQRNTCYKRPIWRGSRHGVKNLFELKNLRNGVISENTFDGCWTDAQTGDGVLFTPRNQDGTRPDSLVAGIRFTYNLLRNIDGFAVNLQGWDNERPTLEQGRMVEIHNNLCLTRNGISIVRGWNDLSIVHNTFPLVQSRLLRFSAQKIDGVVVPAQRVHRFVYRDNVTASGSYGIAGDDVAVGTPTLNAYCDADYQFLSNVIEKTAARSIVYPPTTTLLAPGTLASCLDPDGQVKVGTPAAVMGTDGVLVGYHPPV
jgi:hypothetical protein